MESSSISNSKSSFFKNVGKNIIIVNYVVILIIIGQVFNEIAFRSRGGLALASRSDSNIFAKYEQANI